MPPPNAFSPAAAAPKLATIQVWMERAGAERSLVIELMERPDVTDAESAALHFDELASGNDALRSAVVRSQQLASKPERLGCDPPCFSVCVTPVGCMNVSDGYRNSFSCGNAEVLHPAPQDRFRSRRTHSEAESATSAK